MNKKIKSLIEFLETKGINKKEIQPYISQIENDLKNKKYGLVWEEKPETIKENLKNKFIYLEEDIKKRISKDNDKPENILIEGDNLESLMALQYTHKGLVDIIYIDPPYNTENNDFIYNDTFIDKSNEWRHSCWLSFMNKRLKLAKDLLSKNGVIFISIDNNEFAQLKLLCDEIFGEENFQANISYVRKKSGKQDSSNFVNSTEYILIYSKSDLWRANQIIAGENVTKRYNKIDEIGRKYREVDLRKTGSNDRREDAPSLYYPFYFNIKTNELFANKNSLINSNDDLIEIYPIKSDGTEGNWRWSIDTANKNIDNLIAKIMPKYKKEKKWTIYEKDYIDKKEDVRTIKEHTCWDRAEFNSDNAIKNFVELGFSNKDFSYPKSVALIKHILYLGNNKNAIILDFFAGSGTTGQAMLELNKEDDGNRQFILCTNNENNICEKITYQRLDKTINGYREIEGIPSNLRYYKTKKIEKTSNNELDQFNLLDKTLELIQIKENAFEIIKSSNHYSILNNSDKVVGIYSFGFIDSIEVENMLDELIENNKNDKVAYVPVEDVSEIYDYIDDKYVGLVRFEKMPKELIEIYNKLNRN